MVFLVIPHDADAARLTGRQGHFFPAQLLTSQFADLELPQPPEPVLLMPATGTPEQTTAEILRLLTQPGADQPGAAQPGAGQPGTD
jgi:gluconate kinase